MPNLATDPSFVAYAAALLVLTANLLLLWGYSGVVRGKTKTIRNPEDTRVATGALLVEVDPPEVDRVLRAHKNAMANTVPFAILGLVFVLAGGSARVAIAIFATFTAARLAHSLAYLGGRQPWRTPSFILGSVATLTLMGFIVKALVAA
jgi:microsomal prostaglandin-E synthase 1